MKWLEEVPDHEQDLPFYKTRAAKRKTALIDHLQTTSVDGQDLFIFVYLGHERGGTGWSGPRQWIKGGNVTTHSMSVGGRAKPISVEVNFDASHSAFELRENSSKIEREIYSVLIHEVTHVRDILHQQTKEESKDDYYNKPTEVRAFMQQIVTEIEGPLRVALRDARKEYREDPEWGIHALRATKSADGVERLLDKSATWDRVRRGGMSKGNQRKILQAVARHVTDTYEEEFAKMSRKASISLSRIATKVAASWIR